MTDPKRGETVEAFILRISAAITAAGTLIFLFIGGDWRWSNMFLIPDLVVCAILLAGAVLSGPRLRLVLMIGFSCGAGVFSVATASYLAQGRFGVGATIALLTCCAATIYLARRFDRNRPQ